MALGSGRDDEGAPAKPSADDEAVDAAGDFLTATVEAQRPSVRPEPLLDPTWSDQRRPRPKRQLVSGYDSGESVESVEETEDRKWRAVFSASRSFVRPASQALRIFNNTFSLYIPPGRVAREGKI